MALPDFQPNKLTFETQPGAWRSRAIAAAVAGTLIAWMGSGFIFPAEPEAPEEAAAALDPTQVGYKDIPQKAISSVFEAEGETMPFRNTTVRTATSGTVMEVLKSKGEAVEKGDLLLALDVEGRTADLKRAIADIAKAEKDHENAAKLLSKGVVTKDRVRELEAAKVAAEAELTRAKKALEDAFVRAPHAGNLEELDVELGEYVSANHQAARIVETSPLKISFEVPQTYRSKLNVGDVAAVHFADGTEAQAKISFVGKLGSSQTRTFKAEAVYDNLERNIPAGMSASVVVPLASHKAHFVSPAILGLGDSGLIGVKTINHKNEVEFHGIEIVRSEKDGIWVTGLPVKARIITVGQGYVSIGEVVTPKEDQR